MKMSSLWLFEPKEISREREKKLLSRVCVVCFACGSKGGRGGEDSCITSDIPDRRVI